MKVGEGLANTIEVVGIVLLVINDGATIDVDFLEVA